MAAERNRAGQQFGRSRLAHLVIPRDDVVLDHRVNRDLHLVGGIPAISLVVDDPSEPASLRQWRGKAKIFQRGRRNQCPCGLAGDLSHPVVLVGSHPTRGR